ncbi:MAG: SRPBCC domain-containing protein [Cyanobacteria bacterium P01_A01_bin.116]
MTDSLVLNESYPYTPIQVWRALTNPKALASWLMDNNFEPCVGHQFQFTDVSLPGNKTVIDCEVIALEPPRRLTYTWKTAEMSVPSLVTWMLMPIEGGTQVQLHHSGFQARALHSTVSSLTGESSVPPQASLVRMPSVSGHPQILSELSMLIDHSQPKPMSAGYPDVSGMVWERFWEARLQESFLSALTRCEQFA